MKAAIAHGGGPTAVLNASLAGVIEASRSRFDALYAGRFGLNGLFDEDLPDLLTVPPDRVAGMSAAPGSALGSSRAAVDHERLIAVFRQRDIRVLFYTGGNGSMQTALDVAFNARAAGYELQVIGIPKTIDNDLLVTHHSPGYASTARFFACAARDAGADNKSLPSPICVLETLGRNAGWIVAATSLARRNPDDAPHLIYLPERRISLDQMAADVEAVYRRLGRAVIAVCEGQLDERGEPFGADVDRKLASNLGHTLARRLSAKLGLRARAERPGLVGRSCGSFAVPRDRRESYACGRAAVAAALAGESCSMVALRAAGETFLTPLASVAGEERLFPQEWLAESGHDVTAKFGEYASPLIGEIEGYDSIW